MKQNSLKRSIETALRLPTARTHGNDNGKEIIKWGIWSLKLQRLT